MPQDQKLTHMNSTTAFEQTSMPTDKQIERAWSYYHHADNLQHQRHNIFVLAQTILAGVYIVIVLAEA